MTDAHHSSSTENKFRSRGNVVLIAFLAIAAFFLITEHRAHVLGALPFVLLLACPLLHMFMHRGHGDHDDHKQHPDSRGDPL